MSWGEFASIYLWLLVAILAFRCLPMLLLKGRQLPGRISAVLSLIPPATFAALVANDLASPGMFDTGVAAGLMPIAAAAIVFVVARKTRSLVWSALSGVAAYALLALFV